MLPSIRFLLNCINFIVALFETCFSVHFQDSPCLWISNDQSSCIFNVQTCWSPWSLHHIQTG